MNARLGSIGTAVGGFLAGAAAVVAIFQWYDAPKGKLRATFVANAYEAAPRRTDSIARSKAASAIKPPLIAKLEWFGDPNPIGAFLDGRVENAGSKDVQHVVLKVPEAVYICIERVSKDWTCQGSSSPDALVTIGDLAPLESVGVQIWLGYSPIPNLLNDITLTHSEGVGKIRFATVNVPRRDILGFVIPVVLGIVSLVLLWQTYRFETELRRRRIP